MPYSNEIASGESLLWLKNSKALNDFVAKEVYRKQDGTDIPPEELEVSRASVQRPTRVIAIDGSHVVTPIKNGFPGAEAGLLMISAIVIKLDMLEGIEAGQIPRPSLFHQMEDVSTVDAALPGVGVVHKDSPEDSPLNFFRRTVYETMQGSIAKGHETLLDTLLKILGGRRINCPGENCKSKFEVGQGESKCEECGETRYETDAMRLHEYFDGVQSSEQAFSRFRSTLEILVLLNILRFFEKNRPAYFGDCIFVMDGPLALFGSPAGILQSVRDEIWRINKSAKTVTGKDIALLGVEKTGKFYEHWEKIDHDDEKNAPRSKYSNGTVIAPSGKYIRKNVSPNKTNKSHGADTHFGRIILYKTNKGEHVVINTAMVSGASRKFEDNSIECYPRLPDILDTMDHLATYLYRDGFMPLVRAHANAAIPLKRGADIIRSLVDI